MNYLAIISTFIVLSFPVDGFSKEPIHIKISGRSYSSPSFCKNLLDEVLTTSSIQFYDISGDLSNSQLSKFKSNAKGEHKQSVDNSMPLVEYVVLNTGNDTKVDFDSGRFLSKSGDFILVSLSTYGTKIKFVNTSDALIVEDSDNPMICVKKSTYPPSNPHEMEFYVSYVAPAASGVAYIGKYKFKTRGSKGVPASFIEVDPNIKNNGTN